MSDKPVAWRYQRKVHWGDLWRTESFEPTFETPDDWTVQPLYTNLAQSALNPVQDTWLVGGPDLMAMSGSVEDNRIIQLHFRRPVNDDDRKWLLEAINEKIAGTSGGDVAAGAPEPPLARLLKEVDPELAKVLTDNAAYVRVIRNNVIEECAKIAETTALRNPHNIARDIRALALSSADRGGVK